MSVNVENKIVWDNENEDFCTCVIHGGKTLNAIPDLINGWLKCIGQILSQILHGDNRISK